MPGDSQGRKLLGEQLVEAGVIGEDELHQALHHQRRSGGRLGACLVDLHLATERQIVEALARKFECAVVDVSALPRTPAMESALELLPADVALRSRCLPIAADRGSITVAMADPTNYAVVDELSFRVGRRVRVGIAGDREIEAAVRRLYSLEHLEPVGEVHLQPQLPTPPPAEPARKPAAGAPLPWSAEEVVAALARVMVRRGLVTEVELVSELERGGRT
jgi:type IV pilus assembly protein PilB